MDLKKLRISLHPVVMGLSLFTHRDLERVCSDLELPPPGDVGSKRDRMEACYQAMKEDHHLPRIAELLLNSRTVDTATRNEIQDLLWADHNAPHIHKKCRRDIAEAIADLPHYGAADGFDALLDRLFVLDDQDETLLGNDAYKHSVRGKVQLNVHVFPDNWTPLDLFEHLGAINASEHRFRLFLEGLASEEVRPDESMQREFVGRVNSALKTCGVELREIEGANGYPAFVLGRLGTGNGGKPKNLIFASREKPDLRLKDAISNDVEIVTNADKVLVYDRPIGSDGLLWRDLQAWWAENQQIENGKSAKESLYRRLQECLPENSPPQRVLFKGYYKAFASAIPELPALLPEVWLHWDHRTVRERGPQALMNHRMDFLLLLGDGARVVLEVDGIQHYSMNGVANPKTYAKLACGDRELKLAGYEVFRFGGAELGDNAGDMIKAFFCALFKRHGIKIPASH